MLVATPVNVVVSARAIKPTNSAYSTRSAPLSSRTKCRRMPMISSPGSCTVRLWINLAQRRVNPAEQAGDARGHACQRRGQRERDQPDEQRILHEIGALVVGDEPCDAPHDSSTSRRIWLNHHRRSCGCARKSPAFREFCW